MLLIQSSMQQTSLSLNHLDYQRDLPNPGGIKNVKQQRKSNRKHVESSVDIQTPEITLHTKRREQNLGKYGVNVNGSYGLSICQPSPLIQAARKLWQKVKVMGIHKDYNISFL